MKKSTLFFRSAFWLVVCAAVVLVMRLLAYGGDSDTASYTEPDNGMVTRQWVADVQVMEDASLIIREEIQAELASGRHGILRYVPDRGVVAGTGSDGNAYRMPYKADISLTDCSDPVEVYRENGNTVFRIGDPDSEMSGLHTYALSYTFEPRVQDAGYSVVYINLFPTGWANKIPAGSRFTVRFPQEVSRDALKLYAGAYGEMFDGYEWCTVSWDGNDLHGTLTRDLQTGQGLSMYLPVDAGFYTGLKLFGIYRLGSIILSVLALGISLVLYFMFGRDTPIIPSIQYTPPDGMDSAAVGYIVDGRAEDRDLISLLLYWADQGFLTMEEGKKGSLTLNRTEKPFEGQEKYASILFNRVFKKGDTIKVSSLTHKCSDTFEAVRQELKNNIEAKGGVYTGTSMICQAAALLLSLLPLGIFLFVMYRICLLPDTALFAGAAGMILVLAGGWVLCSTVDGWYSADEKERTASGVRGAGLAVTGLVLFFCAFYYYMETGRIPDLRPALFAGCPAAAACVVLAGFMKKRTDRCTDWMGRIVGLRDFIETAELDRLKVLAQEHPDWFYHILPYTYVFGLTEIFADKLEKIALPAPDWYTTSNPEMIGWNYAVCSRRMSRTMEKTAEKWSSPPPSSGGSSGSSGGGGFSGGGGGFSGGGFGGGGGRSW